MKTVIAIIIEFAITFTPLAIYSVTHTDNVLFLTPSLIWIFVCPTLTGIFYDNIEGLFSKKAEQ
jgi:hypothetical protein